MDPTNPVEGLLQRVAAGDAEAERELFTALYDELRERAHAVMAGAGAQTLQATALVHEAFFKLSGGGEWETRRHFLAVATRAMRHVLADQAKARRRLKRPDPSRRVTLNANLDGEPDAALDLLAFDDALTRLADVEGRLARVVELRMLGGLSVEETAAVLEVSTATVKREWRAARAWLRREME